MVISDPYVVIYATVRADYSSCGSEFHTAGRMLACHTLYTADVMCSLWWLNAALVLDTTCYSTNHATQIQQTLTAVDGCINMH